MKDIHAPDLAAIRSVCPDPGDTTGWAASTEGQAVLREIVRRAGEPAEAAAPGRRKRRRVLLSGGITAALVVGGSAVAVAGFGPWGDNGERVMCARTLSDEADLSDLPLDARKTFDKKDAARSCAQAWDTMWNPDGGSPRTPQPARFVACYQPHAQPTSGDSSTADGPPKLGGPVIFPADGYPTDRAACAAIGSKPVTGG